MSCRMKYLLTTFPNAIHWIRLRLFNKSFWQEDELNFLYLVYNEFYRLTWPLKREDSSNNQINGEKKIVVRSIRKAAKATRESEREREEGKKRSSTQGKEMRWTTTRTRTTSDFRHWIELKKKMKKKKTKYLWTSFLNNQINYRTECDNNNQTNGSEQRTTIDLVVNRNLPE